MYRMERLDETETVLKIIQMKDGSVSLIVLHEKQGGLQNFNNITDMYVCQYKQNFKEHKNEFSHFDMIPPLDILKLR